MISPAPPAAAGEFLASLPDSIRTGIQRTHPLAGYTTLRVGGPADLYFAAHTADQLAEVVAAAQGTRFPTFLLGGGSNVCISDRGVRGLVVHNLAHSCSMGTTTRVDTGYGFMQLFVDSLRHGLGGLEFAVGIPGTVGGALVSNAGAYRQNICDLVVGLDVVEDGVRRDVGPEWMGFSYRDSRLRRSGCTPATVVSATLALNPVDRREIRARARENQRQRIFKQPWYPSAGSFFKNVYSHELADTVPGLDASLRKAGVVPAGVLSSAVGCKGLAVGGAQISRRHGNFVINRGNAKADDIGRLAAIVKERVIARFGVELTEEVLYVGDW